MKKAIEVRPLAGYRIWLKYADGITGEVDLGHLVGRGVFKVWANREVFEGVHVDRAVRSHGVQTLIYVPMRCICS